jgi:hypothetical protein
MNAVSYLKKLFLVGAVAGAIVLGSLSPSNAFLDKTRFVAHLGIAYFCFHRWVWKPYEEGAFSAGAPHRTSAIVKGGIALLFAVHEVGVAKKIADKSNDPLLRKLDGSLGQLTASFATIGQKLKSGHFDPKDVNVLSTLAGSFKSQAEAGGMPIKDVPVPIPGT